MRQKRQHVASGAAERSAHIGHGDSLWLAGQQIGYHLGSLAERRRREPVVAALDYQTVTDQLAQLGPVDAQRPRIRRGEGCRFEGTDQEVLHQGGFGPAGRQTGSTSVQREITHRLGQRPSAIVEQGQVQTECPSASNLLA
ncbi:MAG: hypothetical protein M0Z82_08185 [Actinomycetota bacterium]|nr:hypothetical protein [Actinomycetota bacterium]